MEWGGGRVGVWSGGGGGHLKKKNTGVVPTRRLYFTLDGGYYLIPPAPLAPDACRMVLRGLRILAHATYRTVRCTMCRLVL